MIRYIFSLYKTYRETVHYLFFGVATTLVNWVVYTVLVTAAALSVTAGNAVVFA